MARPILEAIQLSRSLEDRAGGRILLDQVSFALDRGEVLAVSGPSGAGKSTLLRLLNRLDEPTGGRILLDGRDTHALDPRALRRRMGMVMQRAYLFPGTVADNIAYGPAQAGAEFPPARIEALLNEVGMAGYAGRDTASLSGGEAQRVSIARALANRPEVLLLDEPTSALDPKSKQSIERLLTALVRQHEMASVWVTHDADQAQRVAGRVLRIVAGRAVALGSPAEILAQGAEAAPC